MSARQRLDSASDFVNAATDAEVLALLLRVLKPSIVATFGHAILQQFSALEACLAQHEERLLEIPDFPNKPSLLKELQLAQQLCAHIEAEVSRHTDRMSGSVGPMSEFQDQSLAGQD